MAFKMCCIFGHTASSSCWNRLFPAMGCQSVALLLPWKMFKNRLKVPPRPTFSSHFSYDQFLQPIPMQPVRFFSSTSSISTQSACWCLSTNKEKKTISKFKFSISATWEHWNLCHMNTVPTSPESPSNMLRTIKNQSTKQNSCCTKIQSHSIFIFETKTKKITQATLPPQHCARSLRLFRSLIWVTLISVLRKLNKRPLQITWKLNPTKRCIVE